LKQACNLWGWIEIIYYIQVVRIPVFRVS
jgi:hypothetical protein